MRNEEILAAAAVLETTSDLLGLLNKIKMDDLGDKGHPFIQPHLNYFIHPARNKNSYTSFSIPKKSGGVRVISAPRLLLKSFLTYTNRLLQAFYESPEYVTGFVPGKCVVDNAERHLGKNYVFNTDLKDFFPSITKSRVWATLKHPPFNFNDTIADAISGLCCTEVTVDGEQKWVLPQGSPCSPILTNIVCRNLDRMLHRLAIKYNLRYSRYADDITFSCDRNVFQKGGQFRAELEEIVSNQNFVLNEKKTRIQKKGQRQEVTGLVVSDRVNVERGYVRDLDNLLHIWERYGEADAYAKFLSHYAPKCSLYAHKPNMRSVIQGRLHYLKMVKGADNEVWRRLQRRYNKLAGISSISEEATIKYRYTVEEFEKKTGTQLLFFPDDKGVLHCSFILNNKSTTVGLSKNARSRVSNILARKDNAALDKFKASFLVLYYECGDKSFWRIERKRTQAKSAPSFLKEPAKELDVLFFMDNVNVGDRKEVSISGKSTDEVLAALIESNFDLNTLEEWDKIRNG